MALGTGEQNERTLGAGKRFQLSDFSPSLSTLHSHRFRTRCPYQRRIRVFDEQLRGGRVSD